MSEEDDLVVFHFAINGTDTNPFARWGLRQNPFPQLSTSEAPIRPQLVLQSLGGEPIKDAADIRRRLKGFDEKFIQGVIDRWVPGEYVRVRLTWPRG